MKCFQHRDNDAIAICKSCAKGVCSVCAIDASPGVACSEACKVSSVETSEMIRAGVVDLKLKRTPDLLKACVWKAELWRHADQEKLSRDAAVSRRCEHSYVCVPHCAQPRHHLARSK